MEHWATALLSQATFAGDDHECLFLSNEISGRWRKQTVVCHGYPSSDYKNFAPERRKKSDGRDALRASKGSAVENSRRSVGKRHTSIIWGRFSCMFFSVHLWARARAHTHTHTHTHSLSLSLSLLGARWRRGRTFVRSSPLPQDSLCVFLWIHLW